MCDCYNHKCAHPECATTMPMHLEDFDTDSDEINVYCEKHLPSTTLHQGTLFRYKDEDEKEWSKLFVEPLTENAIANIEGNTPNAWDVEVVAVFLITQKAELAAETEANP